MLTPVSYLFIHGKTAYLVNKTFEDNRLNLYIDDLNMNNNLDKKGLTDIENDTDT